MKKSKLIRFLAVILVCSFCVALVPMTASAATTTPYYLTYGSWYECNAVNDRETGVGCPKEFNIYMYGNSSSGSGTLYDNACLNWDYFNIYIDCNEKEMDYGIWFRLIKDGEDYVFDSVSSYGNADRLLYSGTLPDGNYEMTFLSHKEKNFLFVYWSYEYHYNFYFTVDHSAPTITGALTSTKYTNSAFTVSASDSLSGIKTFWYAEPGDTYFKKASGTSVTIPAGSATGYYHFFAVDNAGNESATHYVYYDNSLPTGTIYSYAGIALSGTYTNQSFYYSSSDSGSGVSYRQVCKPGGSWETYTNGSYITASSPDGYYRFRTVDRAGNTSAIKGITLDSTLPTGTLYVDDSVVSNNTGKIGSNVKCVFTDATSGVKNAYVKKPGSSTYVSYTSGTKLTTYGTYSFYCTDYAGNTSATYIVTLNKPLSSYTITYNANGGSNAPASQVKTEGVNLTLTTAQPTRTGYTFKGWSTSSTGINAAYLPGATYTANASLTLYAVWERNTYTVSYNANGGSGAPASQTKTYGTALTLSSTKPTRSGYTFLGWSSSSTASSPSYYAGGTFSGNYGLTLYAVWEKIPEQYTVSYNANGGSGAPASQTKTENVSLTLSATVPTRKYYNFLGWSTSSTASSASYVPGDTYSANSVATLYAVWEYAPGTYTVRYNANGGSGAPSAQTKTGGVTLTLSSVKPTRERYTFKGWSTSSTATTATYQPGGSYTADAETTLYAVWEKDNYEFSISNLTVSESDIYRYGTATVKVRTDSWDQEHAYSNIPVQLYYDGVLVATQYVNFAKYGVANSTFTVNVGDTPGNHTLEARVNWSNRTYETNTGNNSVNGSLTVKDYEYEMSMSPIANAPGTFTAGNDVISSFVVNNDSDFDITPDMGNTALFRVYYYEGGNKVYVTSRVKNDVVIPGRSANLVWFDWTVPEGLAGKTVYCECVMNADGSLTEANTENNTTSYQVTVKAEENTQTPNTRYERTAPASYSTTATTPAEDQGTATWTVWEYSGGGFVLKKYGITVNNSAPEIRPDSTCTSAYLEDGTWNLKSGYGIDLTWNPTISAVNGCVLPPSDSYTPAQKAYVLYPEYRYSSANGKYDTIRDVGGALHFNTNTDADGNARVHFIPVYVSDGNYAVSVTATEIWTPIGMIYATRNSNAVKINGSIYDDYYVGN